MALAQENLGRDWLVTSFSFLLGCMCCGARITSCDAKITFGILFVCPQDIVSHKRGNDDCSVWLVGVNHLCNSLKPRLKLSSLSTSSQSLFRTNSDKLAFHTIFGLASTSDGELSGNIRVIDGMFIRSGEGGMTYSTTMNNAKHDNRVNRVQPKG
jgi:hypothetical protein